MTTTATTQPTASGATAAARCDGPQIARFAQLPTKSRSYESTHGVPQEAFEALTAKTLYLVMAPEGAKGTNHNPPIKGTPGLTVQIARCPPGNGPVMHRHVRTVENFMCLQGEFEVRWGEQGEHQTTLRPFDMISVPPNEYRAFRNIGSEDALLLVLIQGDNDKLNDVTYGREIGEMVVQRFGADVKTRMVEGMGWNFA